MVRGGPSFDRRNPFTTGKPGKIGGESALIVGKTGLGFPEPDPRGEDAVVGKHRLHDLDRDPEIARSEIDAGGRGVAVEIALQGLYGAQELGGQGPLVLLAPGHEVSAGKPRATRLLRQQEVRKEPRPFEALGGSVPIADEEAIFITDPRDGDRRARRGTEGGVLLWVFRDPQEVI